MLHILSINGGMQVVSMKNNQLFSMVKPVTATIFVGVDGNFVIQYSAKVNEWNVFPNPNNVCFILSLSKKMIVEPTIVQICRKYSD